MAERPDLARERYTRSEGPRRCCYADPRVLTDEVIRLYLAPLFASPERTAAFALHGSASTTRTRSLSMVH